MKEKSTVNITMVEEALRVLKEEPRAKRGTGRTTEQIRTAPYSALYVWPASTTLRYPAEIARALGRTDITFVSVDNYYVARGRVEPIVFDHAVWGQMTQEQARGWRAAQFLGRSTPKDV